MLILTTSFWRPDDNPLSMMQRLLAFVEHQHDIPLLWKLTEMYLACLHRREEARGLDVFSGIAVDPTTADPALVCDRGFYPMSLVGPIK